MKFLATLSILLVTSLGMAQERPNILFCIADDASWEHFGAYGCSWVDTPGFDRVAKSGILFNRAYTPNAKCAPSRASILTGRNSWQLKEAANHMNFFPSEFLGFMEALENGGYKIGNTGKGWGPGLAPDAEGKERQLTGPDFEKFKTPPPAKSMSSIDYATNFTAFLNDREGEEPFCFWYGATEPHRAYEFGASLRVGGKTLDQIDRVPKMWPDNEIVRTDMLDYAFEIEHFDRHLARMLTTLEER
ncbi:MAG: sulfatase-like hydrolase/transferase, partial [Verrucomicrobiota bacterium]